MSPHGRPLGVALALLAGACSAVEPLRCPETPYFHRTEEGLPACGPAPSPEDETWEVEDWPAAAPTPIPIDRADEDRTYYGGLEASPGGCSSDVDGFRFTLAEGLPRFVEARARLERPLGDASQPLQLGSATPLDSVVCFTLGRPPATSLLLFAGQPATLEVAHLAPDTGGAACPRGGPGAAYRLELELRGEAAARDLGRVDAAGPSARATSTPEALNLYAVESEPGAPLTVRTWDPDDPAGSRSPPRFLAVDETSGRVAYVDEATWRAQPAGRRYFEVATCWASIVEVTLDPG